MSRILDGKPAEMCELPHGSREIEAQIGGYLPGLQEDAARDDRKIDTVMAKEKNPFFNGRLHERQRWGNIERGQRT